MSDLTDIVASLNPVQRQVAILTNELCNLLDASRPLSRPARMDILNKATKAMQKFTEKANATHNLSPIDKRKLTMRLLKKRYHVQM